MRSLTATLLRRFGDALLRPRSHSLHPENEGMSAAQTRYSIVTPIRGSAAMTHGDSGRHTAHALRRCATTSEESLSAPGERGDVRSADTLSVNPGLRPGQSNQRSMHRNAVPLRHKLVFAFWIKPAAGCASEKSKQASFFSRLARFFSRLALTFDNLGCASEKSKFQASLILLFLSACTNFAKNFYEEAEIGRGEKSLV